MNAPKHQYAEMYPQLGRGPVSTESAVSKEFFEQEREKIFRHQWFALLKRDSDIANPGDYFVREIEIMGVSVLVIRGDDGKIRAFHNSCTHRGNRLVHDDGGCTVGMQCSFHGWTFDRQGELAFVTDEEQFYELDKSRLGMPKIHLDTWRGFLFVNFDETPSQTLEVSMNEFNQDLAPFPFEGLECIGRYRYEVDANWKTTMNAFQEGYHVAFVHKRSAPDAFTGNDNPYCHIPKIKLQENGNQSLAVPGAPDHKLSPTEELAFKFGSTFTQGVGNAEACPGTWQGEAKDWGFDLNIIFPFSRINVGAGWCYVDAFWPIAQDRTVYELAYYFPKPVKPSQMISQEFSKVVLRDLSREDLATNEVTHAALMAGSISEIHLSDQEVAVRHLYKTVTERVNGG